MLTITRSFIASTRSMATSLGFIREDVSIRLSDTWDTSGTAIDDLGFDSISLSEGASRTAIDNLIKKGSFVANQESNLGKCIICLEEFSLSPKAKLIQMDCSHEYHQSCLVSWLENQKTCPICRRIINEN